MESPEEVREEDCLGWVDINFRDLLNAPGTQLAYRMVNVGGSELHDRLQAEESTIYLMFEGPNSDASLESLFLYTFNAYASINVIANKCAPNSHVQISTTIRG